MKGMDREQGNSHLECPDRKSRCWFRVKWITGDRDLHTFLTKPCTKHCSSFIDSEIDGMGRADCQMWPGRSYSMFPSSSPVKSPWQRHLKRTLVERLSNSLETCPSSFSLSPKYLISLSTLNAFQGVLKVSSCRSMWFNPYRGKWQVPMASTNLQLTVRIRIHIKCYSLLSWLYLYCYHITMLFWSGTALATLKYVCLA